jgi:hypothetical protein
MQINHCYLVIKGETKYVVIADKASIGENEELNFFIKEQCVDKFECDQWEKIEKWKPISKAEEKMNLTRWSRENPDLS